MPPSQNASFKKRHSSSAAQMKEREALEEATATPHAGTRKHMVLRTLKEGDFFGEIALFANLPRTASAYAVTDCVLLALRKTSFEQVAPPPPAAASDARAR